MNTYQQKAVEQVRSKIFALCAPIHPENYEFKNWEVKEIESSFSKGCFVEVRAEIGLKGDEDTLACIFARNRYQIFIGKRGGLSSYNDHGKKVKGHKVWYR